MYGIVKDTNKYKSVRGDKQRTTSEWDTCAVYEQTKKNMWGGGGYDGTPNQWEEVGDNMYREYCTLSTEGLDQSTNIRTKTKMHRSTLHPSGALHDPCPAEVPLR